jgi:hypothetical protein
MVATAAAHATALPPYVPPMVPGCMPSKSCSRAAMPVQHGVVLYRQMCPETFRGLQRHTHSRSSHRRVKHTPRRMCHTHTTPPAIG